MATAPKCKVCGSAHWSTQPHVWAKEVRDVLAVRPSKDRSQHPAHREGRPKVQDLPQRDSDAISPTHELETVSGEVRHSNDLDAMTADQLRTVLAAKREAKRVSQAKWRAKPKLDVSKLLDPM